MSRTLLSDLSLTDTETLNGAWLQWGMDLQIAVLEEELSELGEEITLAHIDGLYWSDGTLEELADVLVCLSQVEMVLRHHPISDLRGPCPPWEIVEDRAASAHLADAPPDLLLLLYTLRLKKEISKTRRYNGGSVVWCIPVLTAIGELIHCLSVVVADLCIHRHNKGVYWDRVLRIRTSKLFRLRDRLEEAREAERVAAEDREVV